MTGTKNSLIKSSMDYRTGDFILVRLHKLCNIDPGLLRVGGSIGVGVGMAGLKKSSPSSEILWRKLRIFVVWLEVERCLIINVWRIGVAAS